MTLSEASLPWLLPGAAVSLVASILLGGPTSRALGVHPVAGWLLVLSFGVIATATMTPYRDGLQPGSQGPGTCDFSRLGLGAFEEYRKVYDALLNVIIFVPLGVAIGAAPWSRSKALVLVVAIALPFGIEMYQLLLPTLDRACQSADVVDNLIGLGIGLAAGTAIGRLVPGARRRDRSPGP